ncbi:N-acetylmuramoyl-L-alanine amidase CwlD [Alteribacillus iranensis]|uniref:N-acetylmuramoyl-L-alanine amidase n=1 Tax=Alteribacillus iranensis TaxID=930128 RepID=A0A1I2F6Q3_9BACI|nr:N-acetylmuramoyl-L-alanine amidase CwlD [Alteribacillus iranensis]SFF00221.1 N-acetylmuramoyl-L-alanine amidase [Alteribacillus iranensis]
MKKWLGAAIIIIVFSSAVFIIQDQLLTKDSSGGWNTPISGKVFILDPGHGGVDGGATSKDGFQEKEAALEVSLMLREYLQEAGAIAIMTREGDYDLSGDEVRGYSKRKTADLHKRAEIINESGGDMFISLHLNAIPSPRWSGAQTFYHPRVPTNEHTAKLVQEQLVDNLANTNRQAQSIEGVFILEQADIPGVLVEIGFLSNPAEAQALQTREYQNKIAVSIYEGLLRHYSEYPMHED